MIEEVALGSTPISDVGSLEANVAALLRSLRAVFRHRLVRRILPDLLAERARSGELAPLLETVAMACRNRAKDLLEHAIARGELPATLDREFAVDLLPSPLYWRMILNQRRTTALSAR